MSAHTASIYHLFVTPLGGRHHGPLHQHVRHGHDHPPALHRAGDEGADQPPGAGRRGRELHDAVTAPDLLGQAVLLNGEELALTGGALPSLDGVRQNDVQLEPLSYAFVRFEAGQAGGWPAEPDEFKEGYRWRNDF